MGAGITGTVRIWALGAVIAAGLVSRVGRTGFVLVDKYLGDALYAVMVYLLLRGRVRRKAAWAMGIMTALECFQLTGIPAEMSRGEWIVMRLAGRLLGTTFSWVDLAAYAAGIAAVAMWERWAKGE